MTTFKIWKESKRGSDTFRTFRGMRPAAKYALRLHKKGMLNDVVIGVGRSRERSLNKLESKKFRTITKILSKKRR